MDRWLIPVLLVIIIGVLGALWLQNQPPSISASEAADRALRL